MFHGEELVSNILTMRYELYILQMICMKMKSNIKTCQPDKSVEVAVMVVKYHNLSGLRLVYMYGY